MNQRESKTRREEEAVDRLPLFRPEVISRQRHRLSGEIILVRPLSLSILLALALAFLVSVGAFLSFEHFTTKSHVSGILLPDRGLVKVYANQTGTLLACHIKNGERVKKGQLLFEFASDRSGVAFRSVEAEIRRELLKRRDSLLKECVWNKQLIVTQEHSLRQHLTRIAAQQATIESEIATASKRLVLSEQVLDRFEQLASLRLISPLELQQKEGDPLEQRKTLEELKRSRIALSIERDDIQAQLVRLPMQTQIQTMATTRSIAELDGQLRDHEVNRAAAVLAPADGIVSTVLDEPGITVQPNNALATLLPAGATLEAHLYAPSRSVGLIARGEKVVLRYQAYPAEQVGAQLGQVTDISASALTPSEYEFRTSRTLQEPMYEIVATLPAQAITVNGQTQDLRAGMDVEADVLLERRSVIEFIFRPILAWKGRLQA